MMEKIWHTLKKEFIQLRRDKRMLPIVFIAPVLQLIVFGYAATTDIKNVSTVVCDMNRTYQSRLLIDRFINSGYFDLNYYVQDKNEIKKLLDSGKARVSIYIPNEFAMDLERRKTASVEVIIDGTDNNAAVIIRGYIEKIIGDRTLDLTLQRMNEKGVIRKTLPLDVQLRVRYNPELISTNYMIPGTIALILLVMTMILTSFAIVKEKESGTIEQLIVTPIRQYQLILGKVLPFVVIGFFDVLLVVLVGTLWFKVPIKGSVFTLFFLSGFFLLTTLSLGIFISTISRSQQQAVMTAIFIMLPNMILSGFIFPIENMPAVVQYFTYLVPLRYYLIIVRDIFLKGSGLAELWTQAIPLLALGLMLLVLSIKNFSKKLQ